MSVPRNDNPTANKTPMLCSQPGRSEGRRRRAGCCSSHSLTRLEASPADSLTDWLEEGLVKSFGRLAAGSVTEWERWFSKRLMCHPPQGGGRTLRKVSRCQSGNVSASGRAFTNLTPRAEGRGKQGGTDVRLKKRRKKKATKHWHRADRERDVFSFFFLVCFFFQNMHKQKLNESDKGYIWTGSVH